MARRKQSSSISPQQLKAFAVATVLMVGLLAMVAGGEDAGIAAQVQARQAKNDLIAVEQKNLGTRKIVAGLRVDNGGYGGFGDDGGGNDGGFAASASGGSSRPAPPPPSPGANAPNSESLANLKPGQKIIRQRPPKRLGEAGSENETGSRGGPPGENGRTGSGEPHDTSQVAAAIEASRQRSGSSNANGD